MNYVICIYEENNGLIGVAANYLAAVDFLIKKYWLDENEVTDEGIFVCEKFGEKWIEAIENLTLQEFNEVFFSRFYLEKEEVHYKY